MRLVDELKLRFTPTFCPFGTRKYKICCMCSFIHFHLLFSLSSYLIFSSSPSYIYIFLFMLLYFILLFYPFLCLHTFLSCELHSSVHRNIYVYQQYTRCGAIICEKKRRNKVKELQTKAKQQYSLLIMKISRSLQLTP